ncbi:MAG: hypothetical protein LBD08_02805 [Treponema sp.]|jgi:hypothetical protein|nr:hypothetical protein [Treponema sp.]
MKARSVIVAFFFVASAGVVSADNSSQLSSPGSPGTHYVPLSSQVIIPPRSGAGGYETTIYVIRTTPVTPSVRIAPPLPPPVRVSPPPPVKAAPRPVLTPPPAAIAPKEPVIRYAPYPPRYETLPPGEIARYQVTITEFYATGNVLVTPLANIKYGECYIYPDSSLILRFHLSDNSVADYRITDPALRVRENNGLYKTTYNRIDRGGLETLVGPISSEVYSNGYDIYEIILYGRNHTSVTIDLLR